MLCLSTLRYSNCLQTPTLIGCNFLINNEADCSFSFSSLRSAKPWIMTDFWLFRQVCRIFSTLFCCCASILQCASANSAEPQIIYRKICFRQFFEISFDFSLRFVFNKLQRILGLTLDNLHQQSLLVYIEFALQRKFFDNLSFFLRSLCLFGFWQKFFYLGSRYSARYTGTISKDKCGRARDAVLAAKLYIALQSAHITACRGWGSIAHHPI